MTQPFKNEVPKEFVALRLFRSAEIGESLDALSDTEIAQLLLDMVWADMDILSGESEIVSQAIDRLKAGRSRV